MTGKKKTCQWKYYLEYNFDPDAKSAEECPKIATATIRYDNSDGSRREQIGLCQTHRVEAFRRDSQRSA